MSYGTLTSIQSLGIIYSCVSRGSTILAFNAICQGNYSDVVPRVLAMIPSKENGQMTYTTGDYMFHYVCQDGVIFLCITDDDFERSKAFMFLNEIKIKFLSEYGDTLYKYTPYSLNNTFREELEKQMNIFSDESYLRINGDEHQVRLETIGVRNLDIYSEGGDLEQLELMESSENASLRSFEVQVDMGTTKFKQCCRKYNKVVLVIILLLLILVVIILAVVAIAVVDEDRKTRDLLER